MVYKTFFSFFSFEKNKILKTSKKKNYLDLYFIALIHFMGGKNAPEMYAEEKIKILIYSSFKNGQEYFSQNKNQKLKSDWNFMLSSYLGRIFIWNHENFNFKNLLFKKIWEKNTDPDIKKRFIDSIRYGVVHNNNQSKKILLIKLWNWILNNETNKNVIKFFGNWINDRENFFNLNELIEQTVKTMEKTNGELEGDSYLDVRILKFVNFSPLKTLKILRLWTPTKNIYMHSKSWKKVFKVLFKNPETKQEIQEIVGRWEQKYGTAFTNLLPF